MGKNFYGEFGGNFVPETLIPVLNDLENQIQAITTKDDFWDHFKTLLHNYVGRPTPLYHALNLSQQLGCELYLKREDLLHTGAHKINNALGQCLLSQRMGKKRVIAETGAGQHGVATATAAALLGLNCCVYMGAEDIERQQPNVRRMQLLGAEIIAVNEGSATLKDAINMALQDWVASFQHSHYVLGSATGPAPFPYLVALFHKVIGEETQQQLTTIGKASAIIACVGGGSNAIGIFQEFLNDPQVQLIGVEAGGKSDREGEHARTLGLGRPGIFQGSFSYLLQNSQGHVQPVHSVSAGLDYPGVGPQHSALHASGRVEYSYARDYEALDAFELLCRSEGIIPALETAHALAYLVREKQRFVNQRVIINLSGRGDKDLELYFKARTEIPKKAGQDEL